MIRNALTLVLLLLLSDVASALSVTASPSACTSVSGSGLDWSKPSRAQASDNSYATAAATLSLFGSTDYLKCTGYDFSSIPANATINGITVNVERNVNGLLGGAQDAAVRVVKAGAIGTTDRSTSTAYTTSDVTEAHGGSADLWGTTWTPADIQNANFGAAFAASIPLAVATTVSVDYISITVDYSLAIACTPPPNTPAGLSLTCVCDTFGRASLNPSTIFGSNWIVSTSDSTGVLPSIVNPGFLRLTKNTANNAKAATVPGIFPAAGNYISVEFQHYAYYYDLSQGASGGADGIAVTLSDYSVPAVPGAFGGSLGYAQRTGVVGFAAGWIGVALDEYGNYQNPTEGRIGGVGFIQESVGMRSSGSGMNGYNYLAGTSGLTPKIDNSGATSPAPGYYYQVIVDARNDPASTAVSVNRDTTGSGNSYSSLISIPNVYSAAAAKGFTQAAVPTNWQISFTGSTGGGNNIHEIGALRICASTVWPQTGSPASAFNAIDSAYGTPPSVAVQNYLSGHIFAKLVGAPFSLDVAALTNSQISTGYAAGGNKYVNLKLVDNSDGIADSSKDCTLSCSSTCTGKAAVAGGSQNLTFTSGNAGQKQTSAFTLNTAYRKLVAIISECTTSACTAFTTSACSTDAFSVRPTSITSLSSTNATNTGTSGTPKFKAGDNSDPFSMTLVTAVGYGGTARIYNPNANTGTSGLLAVSPAVVAGSVVPALFPAAVNGTATGSTFTYSEVGAFQLLASPPGVYDGVITATDCYGMSAGDCDNLKLTTTWTGVDGISTRQDCIADSFSNTLSGGKYGCNFGIASAASFGRFTPHHFALSAPILANRSDIGGGSASTFTYMGEPMAATFTLTAQNGSNGTTRNYINATGDPCSATASVRNASLAKLCLADPTVFGFGAMNTVPLALLSSRVNPLASSGSWPSDLAAPFANNGIAGVSVTLALTRLAASPWYDGPYDNLVVGAVPADSDGVTLLSTALDRDMDGTPGNDHQFIGGTKARFGRLYMGNAYGSETLPLRLPMDAQYWNGTTFQTNYDDSLTALASGNFSLGNYQKNLQAGETCLRLDGGVASPCPATGATFSRGHASLTLTRPGAGNNGSVDVCVDLGPDPTGYACSATGANRSYLQGNSGGAGYNYDPKARATFGLYKRSSEMIYLRENY